jgi:hypothetical protein
MFVATPHNKYTFKMAGTSNRDTGLVPAFLLLEVFLKTAYNRSNTSE